MRVKIEKWVSSENQEEIHFFLDGDQQTYMFGYNPAFFTKEEVERFALRKGFEVDDDGE